MRTPRCLSLSAGCRLAGGFTLVELLVVVAMIAVLSGLMTARDRARREGYGKAPLAQETQRPLADTSPAP